MEKDKSFYCFILINVCLRKFECFIKLEDIGIFENYYFII